PCSLANVPRRDLAAGGRRRARRAGAPSWLSVGSRLQPRIQTLFSRLPRRGSPWRARACRDGRGECCCVLPRRIMSATIQSAIDDIYRDESRRAFATLVRLLGDFDLAEDALHDAFIA